LPKYLKDKGLDESTALIAMMFEAGSIIGGPFLGKMLGKRKKKAHFLFFVLTLN